MEFLILVYLFEMWRIEGFFWYIYIKNFKFLILRIKLYFKFKRGNYFDFIFDKIIVSFDFIYLL